MSKRERKKMLKEADDLQLAYLSAKHKVEPLRIEYFKQQDVFEAAKRSLWEAIGRRDNLTCRLNYIREKLKG